MGKEDLVHLLSQLYILREEGKNVQATIDRVEEELCQACEEQTDKVGEKENDSED